MSGVEERTPAARQRDAFRGAGFVAFARLSTALFRRHSRPAFFSYLAALLGALRGPAFLCSFTAAYRPHRLVAFSASCGALFGSLGGLPLDGIGATSRRSLDGGSFLRRFTTPRRSHVSDTFLRPGSVLLGCAPPDDALATLGSVYESRTVRSMFRDVSAFRALPTVAASRLDQFNLGNQTDTNEGHDPTVLMVLARTSNGASDVLAQTLRQCLRRKAHVSHSVCARALQNVNDPIEYLGCSHL